MAESSDRKSSSTLPQPTVLPGAHAGTVPAPGCIASQQLFAGRRELLIEHAGQTYRLRITQQNKLILNK